MIIDERDVAQIAADVWISMLERDLIPAAPTSMELPAGSQVSITGAWNGRVRVKMTLSLARQVATHMFMLPEEQIDDESLADAIGELVNIIGGNIKSLVPGPSHMGLPGPRDDTTDEVVAQVWLACDDQPVLIVVEQLSPVAPAVAADHR